MSNSTSVHARGWIFAVVAIWALLAIGLVVYRIPAITALDLPDTDDAQRLVEVRDWLGGQDWGDVDQYRMNPPRGANMHWSRLVDLPIAAGIVVAEPIVGRPGAERFASTLAPLAALLFAMLMASLAAFRLGGKHSAVLAALFFAGSSQNMPFFAPLRIDHHNWQIALLMGIVAMLVDPAVRSRSGLAAGLMAVAAMMIGLEMLPHIVVASAILVAAWCVRPELAPLLRGYGIALAVTTAAAYPAFVPTARWSLVMCDSMSPVYLTALVASGAFAFLLPSLVPLRTVQRRIIASALCFGGTALAVVVLFPICAGGPMAALDPSFLPILSRISEARSLLSHLHDKPATIFFYGLYPLVGIVAAAWMLRFAPRPAQFGWILILSLLLATTLLMFMQLRAMSGPNAIAVVAAACLSARLLPRARAIPSMLSRLLATSGIIVMLTSAFPIFTALAVARLSNDELDNDNSLASCTASATLAPLGALPRGVIVDVFDMGPALLLHTGHSVVAGPYHRTPSMIVDSIRFWRAGDHEARAIAARYGATYVLGCVGTNDLNSAKSEAPQGIWARIEAGQTPAWLERLPLPAGSPLRLYRIKG